MRPCFQSAETLFFQSYIPLSVRGHCKRLRVRTPSPQSPPHTAAAATQPSPHSGLVSQPYCAPAHPFLRYPLLPLLRCCLTIMCDPIQTQSVTFFVCYSQSRDGHCCADAPQKSGHFHSARLRYASALKAQVGRAHATHSFRRCLPGSLESAYMQLSRRFLPLSPFSPFPCV